MASPRLLRHLQLRKAASAMASAIMDAEGEGEEELAGGQAAQGEAAARLIVQSKTAQSANPALSGSQAESNPARLSKSMSNTKESIWEQINVTAAKDPATAGMGITVEQAISKFLSTPAGSKLYEAWTKAPWDAGGPVRKAEEAGAPEGTSQVRRSAADQATLEQMGKEAEAQIAGK